MQLDNARMRRFLTILLVLLMPMQSSLAAVVSVAGMPNVGCDRGLAVVMHSQPDATAGMTHAMAGCITSGAHGGLHGHSCPHFGGFALAAAMLALPADPAARSVAQIEHARFDSIVLDVPLPPPTPGA